MKKAIFLILLYIVSPSFSVSQTVDFSFGAAYGETDTIVEIPVYVSNFNEISGMQFTLNWDSSRLHFVQIIDTEIDGIEPGSFFLLEEGILTVLTTFDENTTVADHTRIFTMQFQLVAECETNATLILTDNPTPAFAFNFDATTGMSTYYGLTSTSENVVIYCPLEADAMIFNADCTENGGVDLTVSGGIPPYNFVWNNGEITEDLMNADSGTYQVVIIDFIGNELIVSDLNIEISNTIELNLGNDTTLCGQTDFLIELNANGDIAQLEWFLDSINLDIDGSFEYLALQSGIYQVIATDAAGCTETDSLNIIINQPMELTIESPANIICPTDSTVLNATGAISYQWISGLETLSDAGIANPTAFPIENTNYTVIGSNDCESDTTSFSIDIHLIESFVGNDTCILNGQSVELSANGGMLYEWEENEFLTTNLMTANPESAPTKSTLYFVNITDENGCLHQDSVLVEVIINPLDFIVPVNILTPNNDGKNDVLKFAGLNKLSNYKLTVFNRWGNVVFDQINYQNNWSGTFNNKPLPAGTYYYTLSFGDAEIKSALTILNE